MRPVPASGPRPQHEGLHPRCVLSTEAVLLIKVSAVLIVVTLSYSVLANRSCSFPSMLLLEWLILFRTSS